MARTDLEQLVFTMSADLRSLERQMAKASGLVDKESRKIDKRLGGLGKGGVGKEITRQVQGMTAGLGPASGALSALTTALGPVGLAAAVAAASLLAMRGALQFADDLVAASTKIGITAEQLQELTFAAHENDITTESLQSSLEGLNAALGAYKLGVGDAKVKAAFKEMGFTRENLANIHNAAEFLPLLADKIKALGDVTERVKLAKMMGVEDLAPMLEKGGAALVATTERARQLGLVMSNDLATRAADASRELEVMGEIIGGYLKIGFAQLGVWIVETTQRLGPMIKKIREASDAWGSFWDERVRANAQTDLATAAQMERENGGRPTEASTRLRSQATLSLYNLRPTQTDAGSSQPVTRAQIAGVLGQPPVASGGGGGGRPRAPSKPRFGGALPDYILKAIAEKRLTETSARETWPDGNFPVPMQVEQDLIHADGPAAIEGGYDAAQFSRDQFANGTRSGPPDLVQGPGGRLVSPEDWTAFEQDAAQYFEQGISAAMHGSKDLLEWAGSTIAQALIADASKGLASALSSLLQGMTGSAGGSVGNFLASLIPGFAGGTSSAPGGLALVGERGPELVNLPRGSGVMPNHALRQLGGSGASRGGATQYITMYAPRSILANELMDRIDQVGQGAAMVGGALGESGAQSSVPEAMSRRSSMSLAGR